MLPTKLLICLLVCYSSADALRECASCVLMDDCSELENFDDNFIHSMISQAECGWVRVRGKAIRKICCSDFRISEVSTGNKFGEEEETIIEEHPNIVLLPTDCGAVNYDDNSDARIIGGTFRGLYEFPWMALISKRTNKRKKSERFVCGGTIINSRYILTAAHCVNDSKVARVRVGDYDTRSKKDCVQNMCESHKQDIKVSKYIVHESYTGKENDIALLRLKKNINFEFNNVVPICLPVYDNLRNGNLYGRRGTITGWGKTELSEFSNVPRKASITVKTDGECAGYYESSEIEKKFCAGDGKKDSCKGDSGGPFMSYDDYNDTARIVQFGILSAGDIKCGSDKPGLYTDVRKYMKWILDNIEA